MEEPRKHHGSAMEAPGIIMEASWQLEVLVEAPWRHQRSTRKCFHGDSVLLHRSHIALIVLSWHGISPWCFHGDAATSEG